MPAVQSAHSSAPLPTAATESTSPRLFHLHIPKTGGTSLNAFLEQHYAVNQILPAKFFGPPAEAVAVEDVTQQIAAARLRSLVHGHYSYDIWRRLFADYIPITVLREPRSRVVSCYVDWRTKSAENLADAPREERELAQQARRLPLAQLLELDDPMVRRWFINAQCRQLSGGTGAAADAPSDHRMLRDAIDHLDTIEFIGVSELLDVFAALLAREFGWANPEHAPRLNQSTDRQETIALSPDDLAAVEQATTLDRELYSAALNRFSKLTRSAIARAPETAIDREPSIELVGATTQIDIDMSMPIRGRGWHEREGGGREPIWRWTGPGRQSTIELPLMGGRWWRITFHVISVIHEDILQGVHVLVGSRSLDVKHTTEEGDVRAFAAVVPAEAVSREGLTELSILVPRTTSHADLDGSNRDRRRKGLAITRIRAEAI